MKISLILSAILMTALSAIAQMPELSTIRPTEREINTSFGIEKARLYYKAGNLKLAEALLYTELEKGNFSPLDFLCFANTLNADNRPSLAKEFYGEYLSLSELQTGNEVNILQMFEDEPKSTFDMKRIISVHELTNPSFYNNQLFSANKKGQLFSYNLNCDGMLSNQRPFFKSLTKMPIGNVAFFDNGNKAVVSLLNNRQNTYSLWLTVNKRGKWSKPKAMFNAVGANYAFPFMDEKTNTLYFASDQIGGFGGYDIYSSKFDGKHFAPPLNLGKEVNTSFNEINPVFTSNWLYFSSNGHISKGGYDVYRYNGMDEFSGILANAYSFNTQIDDLGILALGGGQYFTVQSKDDQYFFNTFSKKEARDNYEGKVVNNQGESLSHARILVKTNEPLHGIVTYTEKDGSFYLSMPLNTAVDKVEVIADGYEFKTVNLDSVQTISLEEVKPIIKVIKETIYVEDVVENDSTSPTNPNLNALGEITTRDTEPVILNESERIGNANAYSAPHQPDRGLYYIIFGATRDYSQAYAFWEEWSVKVNNLEILEYSDGLYRIGSYAGASEAAAMMEFEEAKELKEDIWMLKPRP